MSSTEIKTFLKGEMVLDKKAYSEASMGLILSGTIAVYKNYGIDTQKLLGNLQSGDIIGEVSMFCELHRFSTFIATSDVKIVYVHKDNFEGFAKDYSNIVYNLVKALCTQLYDTNSIDGDFLITQNRKERLASNSNVNIKDLDFLPPGYKKYGTPEPETFAQYYQKSKKPCPVCKKNVDVDLQITFKQKAAKEADGSMRTYIMDFEPLWYSLFICPECYFTTYKDNFAKAPSINLPDLIPKLVAIKEAYPIDFKKTKDIDRVFLEYYIALVCAEHSMSKKQLKARLWLQLSWLYEDTKDEAMIAFSRQKAYDEFYQYYSESHMTGDQEQYCYMVMGSLLKKMGKYSDAQKILFSAKTNKTSVKYKKLAERLLDDVKELKAIEKNQAQGTKP